MVEQIYHNGNQFSLADCPSLPKENFLDELKKSVKTGWQPLIWFTQDVRLPTQWLAVLLHPAKKTVKLLRGPAPQSFPSLSEEFPCLQLFERELAEEAGIIPENHPWLKPVRYPVSAVLKQSMKEYPFFQLSGEEVHEVAVGPIHAGIIEPGHFRFQCHGERVYHLEIQLGWQHRDVESLLTQHWQNLNQSMATMVAESIAGDTTIGHGLAHARLIESLASISIEPEIQRIRGVALEMERAAMHLADLGALCNDVAWLPGANWFGELRTKVINALMALTGSRFGRGWLRIGGVSTYPSKAMIDSAIDSLQNVGLILPKLLGLMMETSSLRSRFERTGVVSQTDAVKIGLVGVAARASGVARDIRHQYPFLDGLPVSPLVIEEEGDVMARAQIRAREIFHSLTFAQEILSTLPVLSKIAPVPTPNFPSNCLVLIVLEAWRGQLVHAVLTGEDGCVSRYKIVDPSFHNWFGLAQALRNHDISDFPLCNKSFNLSYCGFDL